MKTSTQIIRIQCVCLLNGWQRAYDYSFQTNDLCIISFHQEKDTHAQLRKKEKKKKKTNESKTNDFLCDDKMTIQTIEVSTQPNAWKRIKALIDTIVRLLSSIHSDWDVNTLEWERYERCDVYACVLCVEVKIVWLPAFVGMPPPNANTLCCCMRLNDNETTRALYWSCRVRTE